MDRRERLAEARTAFDAAVVELYLATSADAPKGRLESCSCCHCRERGQLAKVDRRTAPAKLMDHFAFSALRTLGDESDLRWFAPRLLDLTFRDELMEDVTRIAELCSAEGVWSETEQAVIRRAFAALWTLWVLGGSPGTVCCAHSADLLTACAWVGIDVRPLFAELLVGPVPRTSTGTRPRCWPDTSAGSSGSTATTRCTGTSTRLSSAASWRTRLRRSPRPSTRQAS